MMTKLIKTILIIKLNRNNDEVGVKIEETLILLILVIYPNEHSTVSLLLFIRVHYASMPLLNLVLVASRYGVLRILSQFLFQHLLMENFTWVIHISSWRYGCTNALLCMSFSFGRLLVHHLLKGKRFDRVWNKSFDALRKLW